MTDEQALEALQFHSGRHPDIHSPRWSSGFLGSLRPYQGSLNKEVLRELEVCLRTLAPLLQRGNSVNREVLSDFLYIIGAGQYWALHPEGMLQSNGLIEGDDVKALTRWISAFSMAFAMTIEGLDLESSLGMLETV